MYIRASSFDSDGLQVINTGTFIQNGLGRLVTQGPVQFNNRGIFDIRNDLGFQAGDFSTIGFKPFFNTGVFKKTEGQATSFVHALFHQDGGVVVAQSGSIAFTTGGFHRDASFLANPFGNPNGQIVLGGAHTFTGTVITYNGGLIGTPAGSSLDVNGAWDQRAFFVNGGDVRVSESGIWANSGSFLSANGRVSGSSHVFGVILNTGYFSSSVVPTTDQFGNEAQGLKVINRGTFIVNPNPLEVVRVRDFVNENGRVTVNGRVENVGGTFKLLGGVLDGGGVINGDTFVGGGPLDATFRPGSSTGTMMIDGAFSLLPGGVLELEVERDALTGSVSYDQVIANSFFIDGHISFLIGAGVTEADVLGLRFLDCGGACSAQYGSSLSYDFPGRPGSTLSLGEHGIQISALAPVPEPAAVAMLLAGLGVLGVAVRRR